MLTSRSVLWLDANGKQSITRIRTGTGATAIQAALLSASNADFLTWWESAETSNGTPSPVAATYQALLPFTQLQYVCADGSLATLLLPASKLANFFADRETIDPAAAAVIAITGAATAAGGLVNANGSPAVALVAGKLLPYRGAP